MIDELFDVIEKNLRDLPLDIPDFDCGFTKRLGASQIVDLSPKTAPVLRDHLDVITIEHTLQLFHHPEEVVHLLPPSVSEIKPDPRAERSQRQSSGCRLNLARRRDKQCDCLNSIKNKVGCDARQKLPGRCTQKGQD